MQWRPSSVEKKRDACAKLMFLLLDLLFFLRLRCGCLNSPLTAEGNVQNNRRWSTDLLQLFSKIHSVFPLYFFLSGPRPTTYTSKDDCDFKQCIYLKKYNIIAQVKAYKVDAMIFSQDALANLTYGLYLIFCFYLLHVCFVVFNLLFVFLHLSF